VRRVLVIGAGMGGLAAAVDLARAGCRVTVLERAAGPGGKLREVMVGGGANGDPGTAGPGDACPGIDGGPTVFTMRAVFESLFADAGARLEDRLPLVPADLLARHAWREGGRLDLFADVERSASAIGDFAGADDARAFRDFHARSGGLHDALRHSFMEAQRPSPAELVARLGVRGLGAMWRTAPWRTLWQTLGAQFRDPRLRQLYSRYATYVGSSPLAAPATLMLIAHVEQQGVWLVQGGMRRIALALETLGEEQGADYRYDAHVARLVVRERRVSGVVLDSGEEIAADAVVFNGDISALGSGALGAELRGALPVTAPRDRALSAVTWCLRAPTRGFPLAHHTVFFGDDYPDEFDAVFRRRTVSRAPTVYVCAQDRDASAAAALRDGLTEGAAERLLLLVNAPADGDRGGIDDATLDRIGDDAFGLMRDCGFVVGDGSVAARQGGVVTRPQDWERLFPATGGSLYGRANHGALGSFQRPGAASGVPGLYLAGGSVPPGPGVPMATLSGRLAAARLLADAV
jgi:1-hydroxycarotenoid 3,4-desaturase